VFIIIALLSISNTVYQFSITRLAKASILIADINRDLSQKLTIS
jgi:hypothetical protein